MVVCLTNILGTHEDESHSKQLLQHLDPEGMFSQHDDDDDVRI